MILDGGLWECSGLCGGFSNSSVDIWGAKREVKVV